MLEKWRIEMSNLVKFKGSNNWYVRFMYEGRIFQKTTKTTNKKLAQQIAEKYFEEVIGGLHNLGDNNITVIEAIEAYGKTKINDKNTIAACKHTIKWLLEQKLISENTQISELTTTLFEQIVSVRRSEGKKEGTICQMVNFLSRVVKWAKRNGYFTNDFEKPVIKIKNNRLRYYTKEEEERFLQELDPHRRDNIVPEDYRDKRFYQDNYDVAVLLLDTGARLNEICKMKWSAIDLRTGTITIYRPKVNNESILYMTDRVKAILTRRIKSKISDYIFNDSADGPKKAVGGIRAALKRAGLEDGNIHTIRHTTASRLIQKGLNLYEVSNILGHTNISMTARYAHLSKTDVTKKARDILNTNEVDTYYLEGAYYKNPEDYTKTYTKPTQEPSPYDAYDELLKPKSTLKISTSD
jgi:integrase